MAELQHVEHKCGIFACVAAGNWPTSLEVSNIISMGLVGLQHRGQESAGIVVSRGEDWEQPLDHHRGMGVVSHIFDAECLNKLRGNLGIGHTRYSTIGASERSNCQPFIVESTYGQFSLAHNGELVNSKSLKKIILRQGVGLSTGSDSEVITQMLCSTPDCGELDGINWPQRIKNFMKHSPLSYSLLILHHDRVFAVRDPFGNRPLSLGYIKNVQNGDETFYKTATLGHVASSESCVFDSIGCKLFRDVLPGEIVEITRHGFRSLGIVPRPDPSSASALCIFEYVYFARQDSYLEGQQVYGVRMRCGVQLAIESPVEADLVSTIPESANPAAIGYANYSCIPYVEVLSRNRYVGRTFLQPSTHLRQLGVVKKFGVLEENFNGKRIILIDDSIVRGNTVEPIVRMLRRYGAREIHLRIASPPIKYPCYMGINIPTREELIANSLTPQELAERVGADTLCYLSVEGLHKAVRMNISNKEPSDKIGHCNACLTGNYPAPVDF